MWGVTPILSSRNYIKAWFQNGLPSSNGQDSYRDSISWLNVGSRLVWWFWLIKSLGKIIQNPAIDLMVLINKKFVPGESQISHTNSLSCSCHAPTTTTTTTTPPPPPLHHQQLPSWKANLVLKKWPQNCTGSCWKTLSFFKNMPPINFSKG